MALPPCPRCDNTSFNHFIFMLGDSERSDGGRSSIHERWVRCTACGAPLRWRKAQWMLVSESEFIRKVEAHKRVTREAMDRLSAPRPPLEPDS